jgi:hypothetical protein
MVVMPRGILKRPTDPKLCNHCKETFQPKQTSQRYCSQKCQMAGWEARNPRVITRNETESYILDLFPLLNLSGIYVWLRNGKALYVGQTTSLGRRLNGHHVIQSGEVQPGDLLRFFPVPVEGLLDAEWRLIDFYQPSRNMQLDSKKRSGRCVRCSRKLVSDPFYCNAKCREEHWVEQIQDGRTPRYSRYWYEARPER